MKERKTTLIAFRVTEKEKQILEKFSKQNKTNITDIYRKQTELIVKKVQNEYK